MVNLAFAHFDAFRHGVTEQSAPYTESCQCI
jgi:hypothetical protein